MRNLLLVAAVLFGLHHYWTGRPIDPGPGQVAPHDPVQLDLRSGRAFRFKGFQMTALAEFEVEARVLSARDYGRGIEAELSPTDLALGWGPMSDSRNLEAIDIDQYGRFYHWHTREPPIAIREIGLHSANMHIIPADESVARALDGIRTGHVVRFRGELVEARRDTWRWRSSLSRRDAGGGACEVVFVTDLEVVDPSVELAARRR